MIKQIYIRGFDNNFSYFIHDGKGPDIAIVDPGDADHLIAPQASVRQHRDEERIMDTEEIVEESLSLEEKEKELIRKALDKHSGKRKYAALDLGISERTLYRKIKEYSIE